MADALNMPSDRPGAGAQAHERELFDHARLLQLSHDLRTPLTVMLGYAELLQAANPREDQQQGLDALLRAGGNLDAVVEHLLSEADALLGTIAPDPVITAMDPVLEGTGEPAADEVSIQGQRQALARATSIDDSVLLEMVETQREALAGLQKTADTDFLTGIGNRRAIEQRLEAEWHRSQRHLRPLTVLLVDIDELKAINDSRGHLGGDYVIVEVARRLAAAIRLEDEVARIGGDEFMVVCPETDGVSARAIARKLTKAVAMPPIEAPTSSLQEVPDASAPVRVSIGWASTSSPHASRRALVAAADIRLYNAKRRRARSVLVDAGAVHPAAISRRHPGGGDPPQPLALQKART